MRYGKEHKAETHRRVVEAAARRFRRNGIEATGVVDLMADAGLTHGGFYAHFPSKEALVAEVSAASLARAAARWERISHETDPATALARIVQSYLDPAHVAAVEHGCVLTTLGPDIARREDARPAITAAIRRMVDALAHCLPERRRRKRALAALSTLVGAVVLARLCDDGQLAKELLAAAEETAGKAAAR